MQVLTNSNPSEPGLAFDRRGAALDQDLTDLTDDVHSNATPNPNPSEPGVAFDHRGAALDQHLTDLTDDVHSNATPNPNAAHNSEPSEPGVAFGREMVDKTEHQLPNAAPLPSRLVSGSVGAIALNFKSVTNRTRNRIQRSPGAMMWQRNYYEHIIRNEESLQHLRQYIHNNPLSWQEDQLHPDGPSKW